MDARLRRRTVIGSRAKVVLVVLRAAKEFFVIVIDYLPFFRLLKNPVYKILPRIFSGTICHRN